MTLVYTLPDGRQLQPGTGFTLDGVQYPQNWLQLATAEDLSARGITIEDVQPPEPPPPTVEELLAYLAEKRWRVETGGCPFGGMVIKTDRESQIKMTAAWTRANADPAFSIPNWKIAPGVFISLDNATILAVGDAVTAHIQACFDMEEALTAEILAGTITTYAEIDAAAWPPNA